MTPLRQKMINTLVLKGYSPKMQSSYLYAVEKVAKYFHRSPDAIDAGELENYFLHLLTERHMASASVRLIVNAMRFFYTQVLQRPPQNYAVRYPKLPQRIPELLTREEVQRLLSQTNSLKNYTLLATCYAVGLRVSELVHLSLRDIDSAREILHVRGGKGNKDRELILSPTLLHLLRRYWCAYRPSPHVFCAQNSPQPLSACTAQKVFRRAKRAAAIDKKGGIHSLRHAYATHQLEAGMPTYKLQRLLGHSDIHSTLRYVHWLPSYQSRGQAGTDLLCWPDRSA